MNDPIAPAKLSENQAEDALKARRQREADAYLAEQRAAGEAKAQALQPLRQNFDIAEQFRLTFRANVPAGVSLDRVLEPDYFKHVAGNVKPGYRIEVMPADGAWYAELLVRKTTKEEVHCWLLLSVDLNAQAESALAQSAADYKVAFGGAHKWRVIRLSDNEVLHHGEPTEADAKAWLANFLKG